MLLLQSSRIEDQRSTINPDVLTSSAPTVPDEDFFSLIQRVQSNRLDEQRSAMPATLPPPPLPPRDDSAAPPPGGAGGAETNSLPSALTALASQTSTKRGSKKKDKKDKDKKH